LIASGGDDGRVRFWDLRQPDKALRVLGGHGHWVTGVRHNAFHDQLVVSCGTDSVVNLWGVPSLSSMTLGASAEDEAPAEEQSDGLIKTYNEHEDSVYSVAWSRSEVDAWVFASLSFDGRVVINEVPQEEKYKILL
jgi:WD40 repeat protein